jgi:LEA14-like dessication related protein
MLRNLAIAAVLAAGGCSIFMRSVEKPTVDVRDVAMTSMSLAGVEGQVRLDVTNPNAVGVPLSGIDWQLAVAGAPAVTGHVDVSQTIPPHGVAPVTASLRIDAADAIAVAQRVAAGGRDYQLDARLHFSTALGEISVDVHKDGALADRLAQE